MYAPIPWNAGLCCAHFEALCKSGTKVITLRVTFIVQNNCLTLWEVLYYPMWYRVVWERLTDVSEEHTDSIFRVSSKARSTHQYIHVGYILSSLLDTKMETFPRSHVTAGRNTDVCEKWTILISQFTSRYHQSLTIPQATETSAHRSAHQIACVNIV
jgi:hypothetical protein